MTNTGRLLKQAANNLSQQFDQLAKQHGLTGTQMSIIDFLGRKAFPIYLQSTIEKEFQIKRSTTTELLKGMEKKDLIYRQVSENDARQRSVHLTAKGQNLVAISNDYITTTENQLRQSFSEEDVIVFEKILRFYIDKTKTED